MKPASSMTGISSQKSRLLRASLILLGTFIVMFGIFHVLDPYPLKDWIYLRIALQKIGVSGLLLFVLCVATMPLAAPLSLLIMAGSSAYGAPLGIVLSYAGCLLNANIAFFLVKAVGVEHSWGNGARTGRIKGAIQENGYLLVLILQLLTFIPFTMINTAAAASGVSWRDFMKATIFGILPSIVFFSVLGEAVASDIISPRLYFSLVSSMALVIILVAVLKRNAQVRGDALL